MEIQQVQKIKLQFKPYSCEYIEKGKVLLADQKVLYLLLTETKELSKLGDYHINATCREGCDIYFSCFDKKTIFKYSQQGIAAVTDKKLFKGYCQSIVVDKERIYFTDSDDFSLKYFEAGQTHTVFEKGFADFRSLLKVGNRIIALYKQTVCELVGGQPHPLLEPMKPFPLMQLLCAIGDSILVCDKKFYWFYEVGLGTGTWQTTNLLQYIPDWQCFNTSTDGEGRMYLSDAPNKQLYIIPREKWH